MELEKCKYIYMRELFPLFLLDEGGALELANETNINVKVVPRNLYFFYCSLVLLKAIKGARRGAGRGEPMAPRLAEARQLEGGTRLRLLRRGVLGNQGVA